MEGSPKDERISEIELEVSNLEKKYLNEEVGPEIEPMIKPLVVSLRMHGFNTTGSCGGHMNERKPDEYPYVTICANWYDNGEDPDDWDKALNDWEQEVLRLQKFIDSYYESIGVGIDDRKISIKTASRGWMSIQFNGNSVTESQKSVKEFSEFLRE